MVAETLRLANLLVYKPVVCIIVSVTDALVPILAPLRDALCVRINQWNSLRTRARDPAKSNWILVVGIIPIFPPAFRMITLQWWLIPTPFRQCSLLVVPTRRLVVTFQQHLKASTSSNELLCGKCGRWSRS